VPKKSKSTKRRAPYQSPPPRPRANPFRQDKQDSFHPDHPVNPVGKKSATDFSHAIPIAPAPFELREDGSIAAPPTPGTRPSTPALIFRSDMPLVRLYHGNCLELLDAIAAKYPEGRFDAIFADPPYFLSNGGITCHAGKMVRVDKGDWDKSRGAELNHEFNLEWLRRCQRVLKPNGTIWVSGTHHVIFSIGYAMQQLGYKILNDIAWEKPNPPPNLSCRYFTHSTETILWAAKNEKSKHVFNYQEMRKVTGKQMKTVWRNVGKNLEVRSEKLESDSNSQLLIPGSSATNEDPSLESIWTLGAPTSAEKENGKHPTQKPVALVERCLLASTNAGDWVLDPFLGGGTTAIAAIKLNRACVGIELDEPHAKLAAKRIKSALEENTDLFTPPPEINEIYFGIQIWVVVFEQRKVRRLVRAYVRREFAQRRCGMRTGGFGGGKTRTGLDFEREVDFQELLAAKSGYVIKPIHGMAGKGVYFKDNLVARCFRKHDFYEYLEEQGVDWKSILSKKLLPDDALLVIVRETLFIIEVKYQQVEGSVDEKLQTCDFKRKQYLKLVTPLGLRVEYVYVLSDWFKVPKYKDVLDYIQSVNCHYKFDSLPLAWLGLPEPDKSPAVTGKPSSLTT
jgi:site-specific DNA-methyltransferase (adenine-specific)